MELQKAYTTTLESSNIETIKGVLEAKIASTSPQSTADYIAFACDNLNSNIDRAKQAKRDLDNYIKQNNAQVELIKEVGAEWLAEAGIDKLEGMRVSSISINKPKPSYEVTVTDASLIKTKFWKSTVDKTALKNAILDGEECEGAEITSTVKEATLRINKRKI